MLDQKYQKSFKRAFLPLKNLLPRARVSRASHAWQVCAVNGRAKVGSFTALRDFSYTTRANISHEKAEQIRARIVCTPAESARRAWVWYLRRRNEEISTIYTSSVSLRLPPSAPVSATPTAFACANRSIPHWRRVIVTPVSALAKSTPAYPVSATPTAFASQIGQFPHFQRACRQCVHESARLFRVICSHAWYGRNRGERQNRRFLIYPLPYALATHGSRD